MTLEDIKGKKNKNQIEDFIEAGRQIDEYNLLRCSSGNMSLRLNDKQIMLSSSGTWLGRLKSEQVAICNLEDGQCINSCKPTTESKFHFGILKKREDVNVVLHFQSPYATAICCGDPYKYNFSVIIEIPYYKLEPTIVEYLPPGSEELAEAVVNALENSNMAILQNHGLVTVGKDFDEAIQNAWFFELACQILLIQRKPVFLTDEQVEALKNI